MQKNIKVHNNNKLNKISITTILLLLSSLATAVITIAGSAQEDKVRVIGEKASKILLSSLKKKLINALSEGGPIQAISVCSIEAPTL